jgi:hypothetical protein
MKTIHNYGRGHSGVLSPWSSTNPNEAEDVYGARIGKLMVQEDLRNSKNPCTRTARKRAAFLGQCGKYWRSMMAPQRRSLASGCRMRTTDCKLPG